MTKIYLTLASLIISTVALCQFKPNETENFNIQKSFWFKYYDSIQKTCSECSDTLINNKGFNKFNRWVTYWEQYMPENGSFSEARQIREKLITAQKKEHFQSLEDDHNKTLSNNVVNWTEIGPKNNSEILGKYSNNWINPHISNNGTLRFDGHNAKIDRLYAHPNNNQIIYACAGGYENGGGGLFRSTDGGTNWVCLGTDKIPNPIVNSFAIKPIGAMPNPNMEVLFIGLSTGAVYRSIDDGLTWIEAGYNGIVNYPYINTITPAQISNSLPYSYDFLNITGNDILDVIKFVPKTISNNPYERIVVARKGGLYYSDNSSDLILADLNAGTLTNNIIWKSFDLSNIVSQIIPLNSSYLTQYFVSDFEYYIKNGQIQYLANILFREYYINAQGAPITSSVRQYVINSSNFGLDWSFLGGLNSVNTIQGTSIFFDQNKSFFDPSNIECLISNPNYIYVLSDNPAVNSYTLKKYDLTNQNWIDLSEYSNANNMSMSVQSNAFAINPNDENEYWIINNFVRHYSNGNLTQLPISYGYGFHADGRDLLVLDNGKMLLGTDGGIYQTTVSNFNGSFNVTSEGLNASQPSNMAVTQQPPFYIFSGFWHCGIQVYDPISGIWHWGSAGDGKDGTALFLNNQKYFITDQLFKLHAYSNYNSLSNINGFNGDGNVKGSENILGRAYGTKRDIVMSGTAINESQSRDEIKFTNNDFSTHSNLLTSYSSSPYPNDPNELIFPFASTKIFTIPNEPDKLVVLVQSGSDRKLYIYTGMNNATPIPLLIKTIDFNTIFSNASITDIEFDTRKNNVCWMVLRSNALWNSEGSKRIIEYNLSNDSYTDISFVLDNITIGSPNSFPTYITVNSIELDRQTGLLYIGTTNGVYYLDRDNQIWIKYSKNIPLFNTDLGIVHCTGEIYASSNYRGIWKAQLKRENVPALVWKITQNETWNDRINLFCTLMVEPGTTLTIKNDVVVYGFQKIIIKPGGKLILDGGKITTECGDYWAGIEVWGQDDQIQLGSYQGTLITKNNATIEYAREAIQVWNPEDWASTGGIVNCTETTFKNNWRSCSYYYYHSFNSSGYEYKNKGIFTNCSFVWDDGFIGSDIAPAISMYHVNGVTIGGCDFIDSRTIDNPVRTTGIKTIDATYKVLGRNLASGGTYNPLANQHYNYDETNFDVCNFKNLNLGIDASNSASLSNVTVDHCKFENCRAGIEIKSVDNAILTRNKFTMNTATPADIPNMNQMVVRQSTGYRIEGNIFENTNTNAIVNGSLIYNSGVEANETYKNSYSGLKSGNYAFGFNANEGTGVESASGLQWKCNRNETNYFDFYNNVGFYLPNVSNDGVRLLQGYINKASGNTFSTFINNGLPNDDLHLFNNDQETIIYYKSNLQIETPTEISGLFNILNATNNNLCLSKFQTIIHIDKHRVVKEGIKQTKIAELESIETSLENNKNTLSIKKAAGDSSILHSLVNNLTTSNRTSVKSTLLSASPYLSESLLRELGNINTAIFPEDWYVELLIANIEVLRNDDFISFLSTKNNPLRPEIIVDLKARRFSTFTDRGILELEILDFSEQKEEILNLFIEDELADSLGINWTVIKNYLDQRNHLVKDAEQLDYSFGLNSDSLISNNMSSLEQNIGSISFLRMKNELNDYLMFKSYYQEVVNTNSLTNLTDDQINQFEFMAINFKGRGAQQARNILCFFENKCDLTEVLFDEESGSNGKMYTVNSSQISDELLVIPNPNNGLFELVVPKNCAIQSINVIDINGKNVKFEIGDLNENRGQIQLIDTMPGIHIISVTCNENVTFSNRILYNN